jgi:hypothetical protein
MSLILVTLITLRITHASERRESTKKRFANHPRQTQKRLAVKKLSRAPRKPKAKDWGLSPRTAAAQTAPTPKGEKKERIYG